MRKVCLILTMAATVVVGVSTSAQASSVTVNCPGTTDSGDREFSLTTDPGSTCYAFGSGNINGNKDAINQLAGGIWLTLDKSDNDDTGVDPIYRNSMSITGSGLTGGTFTLNLPDIWSAYNRILIAFKSGGGQLSPDWVAFELLPNAVSGTWTVSDQGFSHAILYGVGGVNSEAGEDTAAVPEPTSLALLAAGLAFGARRLRRKK